MARIKRTKIIEQDEEVLQIHHTQKGILFKLSALDTEGALKFLASRNCIYNMRDCSKCKQPMGLIKISDRSDGFRWSCKKCNQSVCSVREGSFFSKSKLPITTLLLIIYVWTTN